MKVRTTVVWLMTIVSEGVERNWRLEVSRSYVFCPDKVQFYQAKADRAIWVESGSEEDALQMVGKVYGKKAIILKMVRDEVIDKVEDL